MTARALLIPATLLVVAGALPAAASAAPAPQKHGTIVVVPQRTGKTNTVLVGTKVSVRSIVRPFVAGQKVTVRVKQGGRKVLVKQRTVLKSAGGGSGFVLVSYKPQTSGAMVITASHLTTPELAATAAKPATVQVLPRAVGQGSHGRNVRMMQQRLKAMGYVIGDPGSFDARTMRAVLAFRKVTGMNRTFQANRAFFTALARGEGVYKVRYPKQGRHAEGDLTHQVLALVGASGRVERIYPISSGKPSTPTVLGTYHIYRKDYGTNSEGMVDASYFYNGYAIHGYAEVPTYAASHGCLRTPIPDARSISDWVRIGMPVDVFYR